MRTILLIVMTCCLLISCGHQQQKVKLPNFSTTPYFYVQLKGKLGDQQVTIQLTKSGANAYTGYYVYDRIGEPIMIWGSINNNDKLVLNESTAEDEERFFTGVLDSTGNYKGTWRGKKTSYPFDLKADMTDAVPLDVFYAEDSVKLLPEHPSSPIGQATNEIVWPAKTVDDSTAAFIRSCITDGPAHDVPQRYLKREIDSFLMTYKTSASDLSVLDTTEGIPPSASWEANSDMKVVWNHYPYLVLEYFSYEYTGGAHGNYGSIYQVLDLKQKKILKPDDLLKPGYKTALTPYLEKAFRKMFNVKENESLESYLLVKEIEANDNFLLTDKGISFTYTPYEIGPYAMGQVTLFIPFSDVKTLLK